MAAFFSRLFGNGQDVRAMGECKLAAIGVATAQAVREHGLVADVVPTDFRARAGGQPQSSGIARPASPVAPGSGSPGSAARGNGDPGVIVHVVPSYKTAAPLRLPPATESALKNGDLDVLTFASSSTVTNFARLVGQDQFQQLAARAVIAAIGPVTAKTLEQYGLRAHIQPQIYTISALTQAIVDYFQTPHA